MISPIEFDYKKATQALNYLARHERSKKISKLKALKLIWAADRFHLRKYARPIFGDIYWAMELGPVPSSVKEIIDQNDYMSPREGEYAKKFIQKIDIKTITSIREPELNVFSKTDIEALDFAKNEFSHLKPYDLAQLSHNYPEWSKFENRLMGKLATREKMSYLDFFENPSKPSEDKFKMEPKVLKVTREILLEQAEVAKNWL